MAEEVTEGGAVAAAEVAKVGEVAACGEMQHVRAQAQNGDAVSSPNEGRQQAQNGGACLGSQQAHGYAVGTPIASLPSSELDDLDQPAACALVVPEVVVPDDATCLGALTRTRTRTLTLALKPTLILTARRAQVRCSTEAWAARRTSCPARFGFGFGFCVRVRVRVKAWRHLF